MPRAISFRGLISFALGAALTTASLIAYDAWSRPASAVNCLAPPSTGDYGVSRAEEDPGGSNYLTSSGTRSDVWIFLGNTPCQRISSVYVARSITGNYFEFGVLTGRSGSSCGNNAYTVPRLFYAMRWANDPPGYQHCAMLAGTLTAEQYDELRVSDTDKNSRWGSYWNGVELQPAGVLMDFNDGHSTVAGERGWSTDNCFSRWTDIEEYHPTNGWTNWDNLQWTLPSSEQPGCYNVKENNSNARVTPNAP